jgi:hypothetical protein
MNTANTTQPAATPADATDTKDNTAASYLERLCWLVTALATTWGAFKLLDASLRTDLSAPQLAAIAAHICAGCIVPYVFTRAVQGWRRAAP